MKIYIGSDHAGYELKQQIIKEYCTTFNIFQDCGCYSKDSVDYPDISKLVCDNINNDLTNNIYSIGLLICGTGTGIGMSIAANKYSNIRCALVNDTFSAEMAKKHNNSNIIAMGARLINLELAISII